MLLYTIAQPHRFRGASSLKHYVFSVARRRLAERHRGVRRNLEDPRPVDDYSNPSGWQLLIDREESARLRDLIARLPANQAKVLELHLEGIENHAIAALLAINYNTVRGRLVRAIEAIRQRLETEDAQHPRRSETRRIRARR